MILVTSNNEFLRKKTVILIYDLKGVQIPIKIDGTAATVTEVLYEVTTADIEYLITNISQINSRAINVFNFTNSKVRAPIAINKLLNYWTEDLDETNKGIISLFNKSPVQPGRDYQLPTRVTTYKEIFKTHKKLEHSSITQSRGLNRLFLLIYQH